MRYRELARARRACGGGECVETPEQRAERERLFSVMYRDVSRERELLDLEGQLLDYLLKRAEVLATQAKADASLADALESV